MYTVTRLLIVLMLVGGIAGCAGFSRAFFHATPGCAAQDNAVRVTIDKAKVAIGNEVSLEVCSRLEGYITLWSTWSDGTVRRIYPRLVSDIPQVSAGQPYVVSKFVVRGPVGRHTVYALWTRAPEVQRGQDPACLRAAVARQPPTPSLPEATCLTAHTTMDVLP